MSEGPAEKEDEAKATRTFSKGKSSPSLLHRRHVLHPDTPASLVLQKQHESASLGPI